jgi:hypothetical protein
MNETVEEVRLALGEKSNARGYRSFTSEAKGVATRFALQRIAEGATANQVAEELGLKGWTLQRWLQNHRSAGEAPDEFHRVEVLPASVKKAVVVRGACGVSVEGLSVNDVAQLLRELSCSA